MVTQFKAGGSEVRQHIFFDTALIRSTHALTTLFSTHGSDEWSTPRKLGQSSGYFPPTGKFFMVIGVKFGQPGGTATNAAGLQTASTDVGFGSAAAPSNTDYAAAIPFNLLRLAVGDLAPQEVSFLMRVPTGRFLAAYSQSGGNFFHIFGYEILNNQTSIPEDEFLRPA